MHAPMHAFLCYVNEAEVPPWVENLVLYNEVKVIVGHSRGHSIVRLCRCESGLAQMIGVV